MVDKVKAALSDLQAARAEKARLENLKAEQEAHRVEVQAEIKQLEENRGERVLEALSKGDGEKAIRDESAKVIEKRVELETIESVLGLLGPKIEAAGVAVLGCKAAALRAEAMALRSAAKNRQRETNMLLKALEDWEQCGYVPRPANGIPYVHGINDPGIKIQDPVTKVMVPVSVPENTMQGGAPTITRLNVPKTELMTSKAELYEWMAERIYQSPDWPRSIITGEHVNMPDWYPD